MKQQLPTTLFYGEDAGLAPADVMHSESIAERSGLHSWEIQPHRHESMLQIFHVRSGQVDVLLDDHPFELQGPGLIFITPLAVHGFRWSSDVRGMVFTVQEEHLRQLVARDASLSAALLRSRCIELSEDADEELADASAGLSREYARHAPWRAVAIDGALLRLLVTLARWMPEERPKPPGTGGRALVHVQRLRALIDQRYREQPTLGELALDIGITTTQLNRACRAVLGHPALAVLHTRLCMEAQRELAYTTLSVKHIAFRLGFKDAGYFSRFFARETGQTPLQFREASAARGWRSAEQAV